MQKTQKTNVNQILFETITLFCERLASTIKANKLTLKILINKDTFLNFVLFFVLQDSKLLKCYAKKFKTIKINLIVRSILISKNKLICKKITFKFTNILVISC